VSPQNTNQLVFISSVQDQIMISYALHFGRKTSNVLHWNRIFINPAQV